MNFSADLGPIVALMIYRVVQEGLIDALRHAQASRIEAGVESDAKSIVVTLTDNGVGLGGGLVFAGALRPACGSPSGSSEVGGAFTVSNRVNRGVKLRGGNSAGRR